MATVRAFFGGTVVEEERAAAAAVIVADLDSMGAMIHVPVEENGPSPADPFGRARGYAISVH
jgi:hypothetical protein